MTIQAPVVSHSHVLPERLEMVKQLRVLLISHPYNSVTGGPYCSHSQNISNTFPMHLDFCL